MKYIHLQRIMTSTGNPSKVEMDLSCPIFTKYIPIVFDSIFSHHGFFLMISIKEIDAARILLKNNSKNNYYVCENNKELFFVFLFALSPIALFLRMNTTKVHLTTKRYGDKERTRQDTS